MPRTERWSPRLLAILATAFGIGLGIRLAIIPAAGYQADMDEFVRWVNRLATNGLGPHFDEGQSFGPVMAYVWWIQGLLTPELQTATNASEPAIRALMKIPMVIVDLGLAALLAFFFRDRPWRAIAAAAIVLLNPAIWFDSAWWGQYEAFYTISIVAAFILAADRREVPTAALLAIALMTKPQALPLMLPFAAWFFATGGITTLIRTAAAGALTILILWVPFYAFNGPLNYLNSLLYFQNERFPYMSYGAWNLWWYVQSSIGGWVRDDTLVLGSLSARFVGYALAGSLSLLAAWSIWRLRTPRSLALALAATAMIEYCFLTTMHERYSYPALVLLLLVVYDWRALALAAGLSFVYVANLAAAASNQGYFQPRVDMGGVNGLLGSGAMIAITLLTLALAVVPAIRGGPPAESDDPDADRDAASLEPQGAAA